MTRPTEPRIPPITDPDEDLREILAGTLIRNGKPLNIFGVLGHHPALLKRFNRFAGWMLNRGVVPERDKELVILRVAWRTQSIYEFGQHTRIGSDRGVTDAEIYALTQSPDVHPWSASDSALLAMVDDLADDDCVSDATWERLSADRDRAAIIELIMLAGNYRMLAGLLNSAGVELDEGVAGWPVQPTT